MYEKYPMSVDEMTFQPYFEVCGRKIFIEPIIDNNLILGPEESLKFIKETYGEDVAEELKEFILKE